MEAVYNVLGNENGGGECLDRTNCNEMKSEVQYTVCQQKAGMRGLAKRKDLKSECHDGGGRIRVKRD